MSEESKYLTCSETAKLVRQALKKHFPDQKFSVKSQTYSGGASIDVSWFNGVSQNAVDLVVKNFEGSGFDGMIDYKYSKSHYLMPDGSIALAQVEDHYGSERKELPKPCPEAREVHFGADYIFTNREITNDIQEKFAKQICEQNQIEFKGLDQHPFEAKFDNWFQILYKILLDKNLNEFKEIKKEEYCLYTDGGKAAGIMKIDKKGCGVYGN